MVNVTIYSIHGSYGKDNLLLSHSILISPALMQKDPEQLCLSMSGTIAHLVLDLVGKSDWRKSADMI